jgi:hypothetical protein
MGPHTRERGARRPRRPHSSSTLLAKASLAALALAPLLPRSAQASPFTPVADSYVDESVREASQGRLSKVGRAVGRTPRLDSRGFQ